MKKNVEDVLECVFNYLYILFANAESVLKVELQWNRGFLNCSVRIPKDHRKVILITTKNTEFEILKPLKTLIFFTLSKVFFPFPWRR